jgi:hypothetical protein
VNGHTFEIKPAKADTQEQALAQTLGARGFRSYAFSPKDSNVKHHPKTAEQFRIQQFKRNHTNGKV